MNCPRCDSPMNYMPDNINYGHAIKVHRCTNQWCGHEHLERPTMTCHICKEEHALFDAHIKECETFVHYLLCGNCYDMVKRKGMEVRT